MMAPTTSVVPSGMMTTGMSPRSQAGTLSPARPGREVAREDAADQATDEPGPTSTATTPMTNPGAIPGLPASPKEM